MKERRASKISRGVISDANGISIPLGLRVISMEILKKFNDCEWGAAPSKNL
jgi:hypothetical protein